MRLVSNGCTDVFPEICDIFDDAGLRRLRIHSSGCTESNDVMLRPSQMAGDSHDGCQQTVPTVVVKQIHVDPSRYESGYNTQNAETEPSQ